MSADEACKFLMSHYSNHVSQQDLPLTDDRGIPNSVLLDRSHGVVVGSKPALRRNAVPPLWIYLV